ncbi:MAG: hypothetical protein ACLVFD_05145 [Anaerostipes hadrus]
MEIVDLIVGRLHETIRNGEIGLDYTFDCNREKNKSFDREYNLSISKKEEILLKLEREHYVKSEESMNKEHINDTVHIFKINEKLMPRYDELADYRLVCIYIKVTWPEGKDRCSLYHFMKMKKYRNDDNFKYKINNKIYDNSRKLHISIEIVIKQFQY